MIFAFSCRYKRACLQCSQSKGTTTELKGPFQNSHLKADKLTLPCFFDKVYTCASLLQAQTSMQHSEIHIGCVFCMKTFQPFCTAGHHWQKAAAARTFPALSFLSPSKWKKRTHLFLSQSITLQKVTQPLTGFQFVLERQKLNCNGGGSFLQLPRPHFQLPCDRILKSD